MLHLRLSTTLFLAFWIQTSGSTETVITCDNGHDVQRLSCDSGVIVVKAALYGRSNKESCSAGRPPAQLQNTNCSQKGTLKIIKARCDGKKSCETRPNVHPSDPCFGTYKYLETNYTCLPAYRVVACEGSVARLFCDQGQVIFVIGADYGRRDRTTCSYKRPQQQLIKDDCFGPTNKVAASCNGKNSCSVSADNKEFGDPCEGTYKYLEVAYLCEYPLTTH